MTQPDHPIIQLDEGSPHLETNCPINRRVQFQSGDMVVLCQKSHTPFSLAAWQEVVLEGDGICPQCRAPVTPSAKPPPINQPDPKKADRRRWPVGATERWVRFAVIALIATFLCAAFLSWLIFRSGEDEQIAVVSPAVPEVISTPGDESAPTKSQTSSDTNPSSTEPQIIKSTPSQGDIIAQVTETQPTPVATRGFTVVPVPTEEPIPGIIVTDGGLKLNVRRGPSIGYSAITQLENGDRVTILRRTPATDWLEIETSSRQRGWVSEQFVEILGNIQDIEIATNLEPTPILPSSPAAPSGLLGLDVEGNSVSGTLGPGQEHWYTFFEDDPDTIINLFFDPNVNLNANDMQFFLYDEHQIPVWPPKEPDKLPNIGAGSRPAFDLDGDLGNGELIWRGGPLERNVRYYFRFVNRSTSIVKYCLTPKEVYEWSCR